MELCNEKYDRTTDDGILIMILNNYDFEMVRELFFGTNKPVFLTGFFTRRGTGTGKFSPPHQCVVCLKISEKLKKLEK